MGEPVTITPDAASSPVVITPDTQPKIPEQTVGHAAKSFLGDLWDSAKGLGKTIIAPPQTDAEKAAAVAIPGAGAQIVRVGKGYFDSVRHLLDNAEKAGEAGDTHGVMVNSIAAGLPLVGPLAGDIYEQAKSGDTAGAIGKGLSRATQAASMAPEGSVIPNPAAGAVSLLNKVPPKLAAVAPELYRSALKPSTTLSTAETADLVNTGLKERIPISEAGVEKLTNLMTDLNSKVKAAIDADPTKTVNKFKVASRLSDVAKRAGQQVNPEADLNAVSEAGNEFLRNQPNEISAGDAQALKQGTYRALGNKSYGELQGAAIESQKALARGLKEELASQFPEINQVNARMGKGLDLQGPLERAVNRAANREPIGATIGDTVVAGGVKTLTGSKALGVAAAVMREIIRNPNVRSRLAYNLMDGGKMSMSAANARIAAYANSLNAGAPGDNDQPQSSQESR